MVLTVGDPEHIVAGRFAKILAVLIRASALTLSNRVPSRGPVLITSDIVFSRVAAWRIGLAVAVGGPYNRSRHEQSAHNANPHHRFDFHRSFLSL
jgi:hypothetical protein